jgi:hypothetical protein
MDTTTREQELTLRGGQIAEVTAFIDRGVFARFGLPDELPA